MNNYGNLAEQKKVKKAHVRGTLYFIIVVITIMAILLTIWMLKYINNNNKQRADMLNAIKMLKENNEKIITDNKNCIIDNQRKEESDKKNDNSTIDSIEIKNDSNSKDNKIDNNACQTKEKICNCENVDKPKENIKNDKQSLYNIENNHNSPEKLNLFSAYGDNQPYHPKVLNFNSKWNGYKYWMVNSPFPNGEEKYENPHMYCSNDLINWEVPKGFNNPVVDTPEDFVEDKIYNSDPHIVYNSDKDIIDLYYRYVNDINHEVILYHLSTEDGINWTNPEIAMTGDRTKKDYLSPAILHEDGIYKMWYVDRNRSLKYAESKDGKSFEDIKELKIHYPLPDMTTWHLDVIHTENGYEMIVVAYKQWSDRNGMNLYYFKSNDNNEYSKGKIILRPSLSHWDNRGIYRSSLIYEDGIYYVFYSAVSMDGERGIGLSYGNNIENLEGYTFSSEN